MVFWYLMVFSGRVFKNSSVPKPGRVHLVQLNQNKGYWTWHEGCSQSIFFNSLQFILSSPSNIRYRFMIYLNCPCFIVIFTVLHTTSLYTFQLKSTISPLNYWYLSKNKVLRFPIAVSQMKFFRVRCNTRHCK